MNERMDGLTDVQTDELDPFHKIISGIWPKNQVLDMYFVIDVILAGQQIDKPFSHSTLWFYVVCSWKEYINEGQVKSDMGAYGGATRRRVYLATILHRPPSGQRPGPLCAYPSDTLHLTQPWSLCTHSRHGPAARISTRKKPMGGILLRESRDMPIEAYLAPNGGSTMITCWFNNQFICRNIFANRTFFEYF